MPYLERLLIERAPRLPPRQDDGGEAVILEGLNVRKYPENQRRRYEYTSSDNTTYKSREFANDYELHGHNGQVASVGVFLDFQNYRHFYFLVTPNPDTPRIAVQNMEILEND
ncbi:unnamed protein product [Caenorhabditis sp. 36 PRJEB53466]|nr:unnamed protein product [Caenorhabditis sp. 36 PRJEB53466]